MFFIIYCRYQKSFLQKKKFDNENVRKIIIEKNSIGIKKEKEIIKARKPFKIAIIEEDSVLDNNKKIIKNKKEYIKNFDINHSCEFFAMIKQNNITPTNYLMLSKLEKEKMKLFHFEKLTNC